MAKIVIIGAGSHVFASRFITDIHILSQLKTDNYHWDIAAGRWRDNGICKKNVEQTNSNTIIESPLTAAIGKPDYVLITISRRATSFLIKDGTIHWNMAWIGGYGLYRFRRSFPIHNGTSRRFWYLPWYGRTLPNALLLNYTNPMATISWSVNDYTKIKNVASATASSVPPKHRNIHR